MHYTAASSRKYPEVLALHALYRSRRFIANRGEFEQDFFAHGHAVSRSRARQLNLKIAPDNPKFEKLLWQAFLGIESYMGFRKPFQPLQHYLVDSNGAAALASPPATTSALEHTTASGGPEFGTPLPRMLPRMRPITALKLTTRLIRFWKARGRRQDIERGGRFLDLEYDRRDKHLNN